MLVKSMYNPCSFLLRTVNCARMLILLFATFPVSSYSLAGYKKVMIPSRKFSCRTSNLSSSQQFITDSANKVNELGDWSVGVAKTLADIVVNGSTALMRDSIDPETDLPVASAIDKFRQDVKFLDDVASRTPQLTTVELAVLLTTISLSALSPFFLNIEVIEVLVPSLAALSASVGISAEYIGKIAVSNGKEYAALAIIAAAEAESLLAEAERSKAVMPFCVGVATTASAFALVAPVLFREMGDNFKIKIIREVYYIFPIIAILAAAIARLAALNSQVLASRAISGDNISDPTTSPLLRTFSLKTQQFESSKKLTFQNWRWLVLGMAPSVVIGALFPGPVSTKAIVCAAIAAAQSAYYLAVAEYTVAVATDSVALKARSAAVSDFYANQASRAGAILPFTSALAGFCAAASAAAVELLPFVNTIEQSIVALLFPSGAALFAAAAAVSKARCEVDAAAAAAAASMDVSDEDGSQYPTMDPRQAVRELIEITLKTQLTRLLSKTKLIGTIIRDNRVLYTVKKWLLRKVGGSGQKPSNIADIVEW